MSVWTDIADKLEAGSKVAVAKAKELSEIAQLKAQIVGCDNLLVKNYKELGKAYYETHKDDEAFEYSEYMDTIKDALAKKDELNAKIAEIKVASGEENVETNDAGEEMEEAIQDSIEEVAEAIEEVETVAEETDGAIDE